MDKKEILAKISEGLKKYAAKYGIPPSSTALGITIGVDEEQQGEIQYLVFAGDEVKEKLSFKDLLGLNSVQSVIAKTMGKDMIVATYIFNFINQEAEKIQVPNIAICFKIFYFNYSAEHIAKNDIAIEQTLQILDTEITDQERETQFNKLERLKNLQMTMKYNLRCFGYLKEEPILNIGDKLGIANIIKNEKNKVKEFDLNYILGG